MSASNWRKCPRCVDRAREHAEQAAQAVAEMYGKAPAEEYERARAALVTSAAAVQALEETFREDYEFYGIGGGRVIADYGGECKVCGLTARLKHSVTFYPVPDGVL